MGQIGCAILLTFLSDFYILAPRSITDIPNISNIVRTIFADHPPSCLYILVKVCTILEIFGILVTDFGARI